MKRVDQWSRLADSIGHPRERVIAVCAMLTARKSVPDVAEALQLDFDIVADIFENARPFLSPQTGGNDE